MKYTCLLWDFNGTLLADMQAGIDSTNKMLSDRGLDTIRGVEHYREIFDFPIEEYYRGLGFDFGKEPYHVLAPIWVELYNINSKNSRLTVGVDETLRRVEQTGVRQSILSASERNMLTRQIEELGIAHYFDEIWGLDNIHAESKLHLAELWREKNRDAKVLFVGDTVHDAETAEILGADCLLYSGGHQSRKRLEVCGYPVIDDIQEILEYL